MNTKELVISTNFEQECIPVGCVPPAIVAISGERGVCPGGCLPGGVSCDLVNRNLDRRL